VTTLLSNKNLFFSVQFPLLQTLSLIRQSGHDITLKKSHIFLGAKGLKTKQKVSQFFYQKGLKTNTRKSDILFYAGAVRVDRGEGDG